MKIGNQRENLRAAQWQQIACFSAALQERFAASFDFRVEFGMCAEIVQNGSLDSAETEIVRVSLHFHGTKMQLVLLRRAPSRARTRFGCARRCSVRGQLVDYRAAGISQSNQPGNLVIGFAGRIVASAAESAKLEAV